MTLTDEELDRIIDEQWGPGCFYPSHRAFARAVLKAATDAAPITEDEQAAWHASLDEGRRQGRAAAEIERADE